MERQFFSGNTVEQAVLAAARHYGLDPSRVAYRLRDKKHGFLNIRRRVVIEVDPAAPELAEGTVAPPEAESVVTGHGVSDHAVEAGAKVRRWPVQEESWSGEEIVFCGDDAANQEEAAFEMALRELTELLDGELEASIQGEGEGFFIELEGADSEILVDEGGKPLQAIEHLLPRLVRGLTGKGIPCRVDSGGFRVSRESELRQLAESVAAEVRRSFRGQALEPMTPADRRLVHLALAEDPTVRTESEGGGFLKRVRVLPVE